jgi:thiol-disulfide isomerase/thioredoxin
MLWWASWCAPGRSDLEILNAASSVRNDIIFVAVTLNDDPDLARQIATDARITIPIVDSAAMDPDPSETWQIEACPVTLHVDEEGTVIAILENYGTAAELLDQL